MKTEEVGTVAGAFEEISKAYHALALICRQVAERPGEKEDAESRTGPEAPAVGKDSAVDAEPEKDSEPEKPAKQPEPEKKASLEDVRAVLATKSQDGKRKEVKALLEKYGAARLSEVKPEDYASILKDAEVL